MGLASPPPVCLFQKMCVLRVALSSALAFSTQPVGPETVTAALFPFVRMATMMSSAAGPVPPMARGITGVIVAAEATKATAPALRRVTAILLSHRPLGQFQ